MHTLNASYNNIFVLQRFVGMTTSGVTMTCASKDHGVATALSTAAIEKTKKIAVSQSYIKIKTLRLKLHNNPLNDKRNYTLHKEQFFKKHRQVFNI